MKQQLDQRLEARAAAGPCIRALPALSPHGVQLGEGCEVARAQGRVAQGQAWVKAGCLHADGGMKHEARFWSHVERVGAHGCDGWMSGPVRSYRGSRRTAVSLTTKQRATGFALTGKCVGIVILSHSHALGPQHTNQHAEDVVVEPGDIEWVGRGVVPAKTDGICRGTGPTRKR